MAFQGAYSFEKHLNMASYLGKSLKTNFALKSDEKIGGGAYRSAFVKPWIHPLQLSNILIQETLQVSDMMWVHVYSFSPSVCLYLLLFVFLPHRVKFFALKLYYPLKRQEKNASENVVC